MIADYHFLISIVYEKLLTHFVSIIQLHFRTSQHGQLTIGASLLAPVERPPYNQVTAAVTYIR